MANGRRRTGERQRPREARFTACEIEHALIERAAALADLKPATYMRQTVLTRARRDLRRHAAESL